MEVPKAAGERGDLRCEVRLAGLGLPNMKEERLAVGVPVKAVLERFHR